MIEMHLGYLAGDEAGTRVELVQVGEAGELPTLELRHQRECGLLGWVTQKRVRLASGQIGAMREMLNLMDRDARDTRKARAVEQPGHLRLVVS